MNIMFWLLILIVLIAIWFCSSWLFPIVGSFILKIFSDAKGIMQDKKENEE